VLAKSAENSASIAHTTQISFSSKWTGRPDSVAAPPKASSLGGPLPTKSRMVQSCITSVWLMEECWTCPHPNPRERRSSRVENADRAAV
jgi:hypothetical protein